MTNDLEAARADGDVPAHPPGLSTDDEILAAVTSLLQRDEVGVAALGISGLFVPMPPEIGLSGQLEIDARSGLDIVTTADRPAVIEAWGRMRQTKRGMAHVHLLSGERVTFHFFDVRERFGVCLLVIVAAQGDSTPIEHFEAVRPRPRLFTMSRNEFALASAIDIDEEELLGWPIGDLIGRSPLELIHPDDQGRAIDNWMATLAAPGVPHRWRGRYMCSDGIWLWMEITNTNRLDTPSADVLSELVDISDEMKAHEALQEQEQLLRRLAEALPLGVMQVGVDRTVRYANDQVHSITGIELCADPIAQFATVVPGDREAVAGAFDRVLLGAQDVDIEIHLRLPGSDRDRVCTLSLRPLQGGDDSITGAIVCITDVTETVMLRKELEQRATFDSLTGCFNRAAITMRLDAAIDDDRSSDRCTAVVFLDVNDLKLINDRFGHDAGDELLRAVAERIRRAIRPQDHLGRLGGDEFLVVCPALSDRTEADEIAFRVCAAIGEPLRLGSETIRPVASAGIACGPRDSAKLVALADQEMYRSKRAQRAAAVVGR
ncbi:MAG: diguanylate cyclase [Acidimicrobiia bacterium]